MRYAILSLLPLGALIIGCQSGSPTQPAQGSVNQVEAATYTPAASLLGVNSFEGTLGAYSLTINGLQADLTPARSMAAVPGVGSYDVDITDALTRTFCQDCVKLEGIRVDGNGRPVVTVRARHPFALGDPGLPITAQNRRDLFLFNVKGIVAADSGPLSIAGIDLPGGILWEPDGYYLNEDLFTGTGVAQDIYPFMVFGVDEGVVGTGNFNSTTGRFDAMDAPSGFNVLGQGQSGIAEFTFDIGPGGSASVDLRLVGQYGQSVANKSGRMSPLYYAAEFAAGPWRVEMDPFPMAFSTSPGSPQVTEVRVWDFAMAHGQFDVAYPSENYLGLSWTPEMSVELLLPAFSPTAFTPAGPPTGTGALGDPLAYAVTVDNGLSAANGTYYGLVKATSNRPVASANPGEANDVSGIRADLDATNLIPRSEIATYQLFSVEVSTMVGVPPVAELSSNKTEVMVGNGAYFFPGPGTMDPDGTINQYAYDFDWDGVPANFVPDTVVTTTTPVSGRFSTAGATTVGLRVRDNDNNFAYDTLVMDVVPVGDPFTPSTPAFSFPSESAELFPTADHVPVAIDRNNPGNVYIMQDSNPTSTLEWAIYRSKDFGRTFDAGTPVYTVLRSHPGDNFTWISGRGITVLADGTLGLICNATATTGVDGRGVYYAWIDVNLSGTGVNPGGGTHDLVRVNMNTSLDSWGDPCLHADATDPTRVYVTYYFNPTGADRVHFAAVSNANTPNPTRLYEDFLVDTTEGLTIEDVRSYLDPVTNHLHIAWKEEILTSTDRWIAYSKIVLNNPVGPRARFSSVANFGAITTMSSPSPTVTTGGVAVVGWIVDFDTTAGLDYDPIFAKIQETGGVQSFITPATRITLAEGQNRGYLVGDRTTGRLTYAYTHGGTSGTAVVNQIDVRAILLDSNLNLVGGPTQMQTFDPVPGPVMTWRHDDPFGAIDPNTGEAFFMWNEETTPEATGYRWTR